MKKIFTLAQETLRRGVQLAFSRPCGQAMGVGVRLCLTSANWLCAGGPFTERQPTGCVGFWPLPFIRPASFCAQPNCPLLSCLGWVSDG